MALMFIILKNGFVMENLKLLSKLHRRIVLKIVNSFLSPHVRFGTGLKRRLLNHLKGVHIGKNTIIVGPLFLGSCSLSVGDNCWIGTELSCQGNGDIYIRDNCDLAPRISLVTGGHALGNSKRRAGLGFNGEIIIGQGCWIGSEAMLIARPKLMVGNGTVIAARGVLIQDAKENCLYAGNPALCKKRFEI